MCMCNRYYSCSLMLSCHSARQVILVKGVSLAGLYEADIYNQCLDQMQMLNKRCSTVGRSNGASGNSDGGGLQTD